MNYAPASRPATSLSSMLRAVLGVLALLTCTLPLALHAQTITTRTLDTGTNGNTGQHTAQAIVNGTPAVAYYDASEATLKFARNSAADGSGTWTLTTVDGIGGVGQYCSLAVVNGKPAISYRDATNGDLIYVRATDASGTTWGTPVTLDSTGNVGWYTSLAVVNGNPAISYYDGTNADLKYIRATDASGTSWGTPVTLDSTGDVGSYTSLAVVNGNPAISYLDAINGDLKYLRATDASGTTWGTPVTLDSTGFVGSHTSLAVVNGNPTISYFDTTNSDLKYVRATDASGTTWGTPVSLDSTGFVGLYTSLAVVNGNPAISYYDNTNGDLKYVRATDASGTTWGTPVTLDTAINSGQYSSLAVVNGNPAISYYDGTNGDLKYLRATDASGTNWPSTNVDSTGNVGPYISQAIVNGNPAISYYDQTNGDLKYVRATDASGTTWGTPVTLDSTGFVGTYTSLAVVNGNPAISYYDESSGDLKYVRATDASGTTWGTPLTLASTGIVGQYTSLAVVNGNPAISYYDGTNGDLKYLRATDASGTTWGTPVTLDSLDSVGFYTSLAVVNGNPAISYYDGNYGDLKYVRATDASGTTWGTPVTLDSTGSVGTYTSLAVVNGNPAISYYDTTNGDLKYVRATDASGTTWGTPVTLDSTGNVGQYTALEVVNGNPAISYYDNTNGDLKYVRATDASGTTWGTPVTLDSTGTVGWYTSLAVVNGNPAISYYDQTSGDLKYLRANTTSGMLATDWGTPATGTPPVDTGVQSGSVGLYTSQAIVNGNPAISYYDATNGDLKYVRATDASGTTWGTPVTVDGATSGVGQYTSLAVVNGNPAISYYDVTNGDLKYVRATDANGTTWGTPVTLASTGNVGQYTALAVVNGNPAISYYDVTSFDLKYVRALDASGTTWGTPVTLASTGNVGQYTSQAIVNGNPAVSYYDVTNLDLKYVRANDASGTSWGTPVTLDSIGSVGFYTSLAVVNGNPAISYYDATNGDLKYVRATDASGTLLANWGTPVTLDSTGTMGQYTSLVVVSGNPAISYYDNTNGDLKYVRATDASGTLVGNWGTPVTLDSTGNVGQYTSLAVVNGNPAISYYDQTKHDLKWTTLVFAPPLTGVSPTSGSTAGGTSVTITGTTFTGATAVNFGGTAATSFTVDSPTQITATTPAHAAGAVSVNVTTPSGTNAPNSLYTFVAPFQNGSFEVNGGHNTSVAQGWTFGGSGSNVVRNDQGATQGAFGMVFNFGQSPSGGVISQTFITVPGQVYRLKFDFGAGVNSVATSISQLQVQVRDGPSAFAGAQTINGGSGTISTTTGGSILSNTNTPQVRDQTSFFPAVNSPAPNQEFSSTQFTFTAISAVSTIVFTDQSTGGSDNQDAVLDNIILSAIPAPTIASLNPNGGTTAGGTSVVITGTDFTGATAVTFGGTTAAFTVTDATHIAVTTPAHTAGAVDVVVTTPAGASTGGVGSFTFTAGALPLAGPAGNDVVSAAAATDATGAADGTQFDQLQRSGFLAENGTLAFLGYLKTGVGGVDATTFMGYWKHDGSSLTRVARHGFDAPETGATAAKFNILPMIPGINDDGQVTLFASLLQSSLSSPVTTADNDTGLWSELGGTGFQILVREDDTIPGLSGEKVDTLGYGCFATAKTGASTGEAAFVVGMKGSSTDTALLRTSVVSGDTTQVGVIARENSPAPGTSENFNLIHGGYTGAVRMDATGNAVFAGWLKPSNKLGVWYQDMATKTVSKTALMGEAAPGTGSVIAPVVPPATFASIDLPNMGGNGTYAFRAVLNADGDNTANDKNDGIWKGTGTGTPTPILRRGDSNTERPGLFSSAYTTTNPNIKAGNIYNGWLTNANHGAWLGWVDFGGDGISSFPTDGLGIYTDTSGTMSLLAVSGDAAPGIAGATFLFMDHPVCGGVEQVAFLATVTGGTVNAGSDDKGVWRTAPNGGAPLLVLRTGDSIIVNVNGTPTSKTIANVDIPGSGYAEHIWETPVMDATGRLLIFVTFDDGSSSQVMVP